MLTVTLKSVNGTFNGSSHGNVNAVSFAEGHILVYRYFVIQTELYNIPGDSGSGVAG